ncbi:MITOCHONDRIAL GROUP I INTRON SPLICING FACTOR CCM1 [Salix purpurea]|uniref:MITOCHONDRIAL GROUP I INTRON SPLICING FACTOR CCM1 n=1 Tax=Salix purpurea TaxID=77065 RepID=A0A9Q0YW45_SALPP|nr:MITOCHONDRIAL GROUP I INTRON SPLICING FACTOR CCM1 [Salix purpurea]
MAVFVKCSLLVIQKYQYFWLKRQCSRIILNGGTAFCNMQLLVLTLQGLNLGLMGICCYSRTCLLKSGLLRSLLIWRRGCLFNVHFSALSAWQLEDNVSHYSSTSEIDSDFDKFTVPRIKSKNPKRCELSRLIVELLKTLNWEVARQVKFSKAVNVYGFGNSIHAFRTIVHVFALAGLQREAQHLLTDIVFYYKEENLNVSGLFSTFLDSPECVGRSATVYSLLIKVFASNKMLADAKDVFMLAKKIGVELNISSCNFLLKCLAEGDKLEAVRSLFDDLKNSGPSPNVYTYTIMINFYCKERHGQNIDLEHASQILEEMEQKGETPTVVTYGVYIHGLCRVGSIEDARNKIQDLRSSNQPLNIYCYNALIQGFCQKGRPDEALKLLEEMKDEGISPDVYSYSILVNAFCKEGDIESDLLQEMRKNGLVPDSVIYNSQIREYCRKGCLKEALKYFYTMLQDGLQPDIITCNHIVDQYCSRGQFEEALIYINQMKDLNILPNSYTYTVIINWLCKYRVVEKAWEVLPIMFKNNVFPSIIHYTTIMDGYAKLFKNPKKAWKLYQKMPKLGCKPDNVTRTVLVDMFSKRGRMSKALNLFKEMAEEGLSQDEFAFTAIIAGYCRVGNVKRAWSMYKKMKRNNITPNVKTYTCLVDGFCKLKRLDMATMLIDDMKRNNVTPDVKTYTALIAGYQRIENIDRAYEVFNEMKNKGILPDHIAYATLRLGDDVATED